MIRFILEITIKENEIGMHRVDHIYLVSFFFIVAKFSFIRANTFKEETQGSRDKNKHQKLKEIKYICGDRQTTNKQKRRNLFRILIKIKYS